MKRLEGYAILMCVYGQTYRVAILDDDGNGLNSASFASGKYPGAFFTTVEAFYPAEFLSSHSYSTKLYFKLSAEIV